MWSVTLLLSDTGSGKWKRDMSMGYYAVCHTNSCVHNAAWTVQWELQATEHDTLQATDRFKNVSFGLCFMHTRVAERNDSVCW